MANYQSYSGKGVMSIIPDPETTKWVPLSGSSVDLKYNGGYAEGVTYNEGDIVIGPDGIAYLCVINGTTGAPIAWPNVGPLGVGYDTKLPSSPVNGQEHILVDSITDPSYTWRLRYNKNSTSRYKWEFVGGIPWLCNDETDVFTPSTSIDVALGFLPTFSSDYSGDYVIDFGANFYASLTNVYGFTALYVGDVNVANLYHNQNTTAGVWLTVGTRLIKAELDVDTNNTIDLRHHVDSGIGHWGQRHLAIYPARIG